MAEISQWFSNQLSSSAEGFAWSARQVPALRLNQKPPKGLGEWIAARHVFHLWFYEQTVALPSMRQWLGDSMPEIADEDAAWTGNEQIENLLPLFLEIRNQQIALLPHFDANDWNRVCETCWGPVTLFWVVTKTYQHTTEHISDLLRNALFWDFFAEREQEENSQR